MNIFVPPWPFLLLWGESSPFGRILTSFCSTHILLHLFLFCLFVFDFLLLCDGSHHFLFCQFLFHCDLFVLTLKDPHHFYSASFYLIFLFHCDFLHTSGAPTNLYSTMNFLQLILSTSSFLFCLNYLQKCYTSISYQSVNLYKIVKYFSEFWIIINF